MSHRGFLCNMVSGVAIVGANTLAYAESINIGAWATTATLIGGVLSGLLIKAYSDLFKARASGILEVEKAKAEAEAYKRRLEMKVETEWEEQHAHSLKGQIEQLQRSNEEGQKRLQKSIELDQARTEDANQKLHQIRNEFQIATLQHREQREALIAELAALKASLKESQAKIDDLKEHDSRVLRGVKIEQVHQAVKQAHQDAAISENTAAIQVTAAVAEKTAAAVEQINVEREAERSGDVPAAEPPKDERS